ncbi:response regulator [Leptolyngbya sp. NIES-2104]|uniref:response regulator n=1 Tax=Leptolyngbya sp. NIES-2104 TaxID=1552121 RepID=UPI0006EC8B20|nr:response regulator [Leptolyngbya sp. NIES-2104]GAP97629.1 two-component hybrid sensor and regulator [Leptolyngbya sp. NIES-2104]
MYRFCCALDNHHRTHDRYESEMLKRLRIGTKIGATFGIGLAVFAAIGFISYRGTRQLIDTSESVAHTYRVLDELDGIYSVIKDAESAQRGYLLRPDLQSLAPYNTARSVLDQRVASVRQLTSDNPAQQRSLEQLKPLIDQRMSIMEQRLKVRDTQGFQASIRTDSIPNAIPVMKQIESIITQMKGREQILLDQRSNAASLAGQNTLNSLLYGIPLGFAVLAVLAFLLNRHISKPLDRVSQTAERIADGDLSAQLPALDRQDEVGILTRSFNQMVENLRVSLEKSDRQSWLQTNLAEFGHLIQGERSLETVSRLMLSHLAPLVGAQYGAFYVMDAEQSAPVLKLLSSYAFQERKQLSNQFHLGEGLVGQCALEKQRILLTHVPSDYIRIRSGLGEAAPLNVIVLPVLFENDVVSVIELASFQAFTELQITLLDRLAQTIGVVLRAIAADAKTQQLLQESQSLAEELQSQQEELHQSNRQLQEQARALEESELRLQEQQEELKVSNEELQQLNEELEEKAELLAAQKREVEQKNDEIDQAMLALREKAEQLEISSRYKSEFLANMSHELRTPLNSLLILAKILSDNAEHNLTEKQVEYSRTIYSSGNDLLNLINDILDLAKIESGTITLDVEPLNLTDLQMNLDRSFRQIASGKGLDFSIERDPQTPEVISTDSKRLQQILKNLLANAFKFTEQGSVTVQIGSTPDQKIFFAVKDTGIGIPREKQQLIFEAFQQVDGTTSRKYGGTGLGLSISRELAHRLGGSIQVSSEVDQGSTFTLYLPQIAVSDPGSVAPVTTSSVPVAPRPLVPPNLPSEVPDDRASIHQSDRVLLIIEDDVNFVRILTDIARQQGFKVLSALRSQTGLALAQQFKPRAILLDLHLPDMDGWTVLDRLKHDPELRHIPVHILSSDDQKQRGLQLGAIAYLQKPVSSDDLNQLFDEIQTFIDRRVKNLLVIEDDQVQAQSIIDLIGNGDVKSIAAYTAKDALKTLQSQQIDCVVMDLGLPDMSGFDLIEQIKQDEALSKIPIIIYTGKELTRPEETQLKRLAETIIIKDVRSPERLLDETALFLHRIQANLPKPKRQILEDLHQVDSVLANKKVLIVDDDVRNIFALTSLLERHQMEVLYAENGREGIEALKANPDINAVLMDIMMPEMDGYETTRSVRQQQQFRSLPIIALTAKAMQGDREKCIEAGASDYITKPVDTEQLLSLLRVWLYR